jgi:hypothetical protein
VPGQLRRHGPRARVDGGVGAIGRRSPGAGAAPRRGIRSRAATPAGYPCVPRHRRPCAASALRETAGS